MHRVYAFLLLLTFACACSQSRKKSDSTQGDTAAVPVPVGPKQQISVKDMGDQLLRTLESGDLPTFFPKSASVLFSPYGYIDEKTSKRLNRAEFLEALSKNWVLTWGRYDGTGAPIKLTVRKYFEKFVLDKKYSRADSVSLNKVKTRGNSISNLTALFPNAEFIGYHFNGTEKYAKMDWSSLYLVFEKTGDRFLLVAVVHDQWTI